MMSKKNIYGLSREYLRYPFPFVHPPSFLTLFFYFKPFLRHYLLIPRFWPNRTPSVFYQFLKTWLFTHTDLLSFLFFNTFQISSKYCNIYQEKIKAIGKIIVTSQFVVWCKSNYLTKRRFLLLMIEYSDRWNSLSSLFFI